MIVWGAYVRATGAGAGCGNHWPLCNGEVIPRAPTRETLVELSHRLSSGVLGLMMLGFVASAFVLCPRSHPIRKGAVASALFVVAEALIGAGLVRFEWVASNVSEERVFAMAFHLVNTFFLLAAMTLTAWLAAGDGRRLSLQGKSSLLVPLGLACLFLLLVGASGAVTALGDTLLFTEGVTPDESPLVAKLVASRFYHPTLALTALVIVCSTGLWAAGRMGRAVRRHARLLVLIFLLELAIGAVNVYLKAPVPVQLVHLAAADALWIVFVLLAAESFRLRPLEERPA